jgi:hypothetical protein
VVEASGYRCSPVTVACSISSAYIIPMPTWTMSAVMISQSPNLAIAQTFASVYSCDAPAGVSRYSSSAE